MSRFYVDFNTGEGNEEVNGTLEDAKRIAVEGITYNQMDITIFDEEENEVARLPWYDVKPSDDDVVTVQYGDRGFYSEWVGWSWKEKNIKKKSPRWIIKGFLFL